MDVAPDVSGTGDGVDRAALMRCDNVNRPADGDLCTESLVQLWALQFCNVCKAPVPNGEASRGFRPAIISLKTKTAGLVGQPFEKSAEGSLGLPA